MDLNRDDLVNLGLDAADADVRVMVPDLERHVDAIMATEGARTPRHERWSPNAPDGVGHLDAFVTTVSEFGALLDTLEPPEWALRTRVEGTVIRDLVEHLVGMERYLLGQLGRGDSFTADRREDHWPATRRAAADMSGLAVDDVVRTWWREVLQVIAVCGELGPDHPVRYHHLAGSVRGLLVSRTFELWTHGDDIRQATGRPLDLLDEARLSLMVSELMAALPIGMALAGGTEPGRTARFELSGWGGGTFTVPLAFGEEAGSPDIVIRTDTLRLCRLAANRLAPEELGAEVEGDPTLLAPVLAATAAFAAD
jgi:uncharacterized protein (TIGR03083 family)